MHNQPADAPLSERHSYYFIIDTEIVRETEENELEEERKGGIEQLKMTNSVMGTAQWGPDYYRRGPSV